ncbi:MAG: cell wall hydrolase [Clostridiales bacterium]|nr:cell wall hydrolase [Clostridiales bacterium]
MWYKYLLGGIFILKRNLIISVVLSVAWVFVTVFAFVTINNHNNMIKNLQYIEVAKVEAPIEIINEEIEIIEEPKVVTQVTSRSGLTVDRENPKIFYEDISIQLTEEEIEIFERIVEAEVTTNNYEGKLAVANVILNRIECERFPNTMKEVVFAKRQFSPISDGRYYKVKVTELTKQVVQDALAGYRMVERDVYYFCTPTAPGKGWFETDLRKVGYIAPHNFYGYK